MLLQILDFSQPTYYGLENQFHPNQVDLLERKVRLLLLEINTLFYLSFLFSIHVKVHNCQAHKILFQMLLRLNRFHVFEYLNRKLQLLVNLLILSSLCHHHLRNRRQILFQQIINLDQHDLV